MKRYSILLFILSLATLQASQQPDLNLNNNNTNTYTYGQKENWGELIKNVKYKDLKKLLTDLYLNGVEKPYKHIKELQEWYEKDKKHKVDCYKHITTTLPVYFVAGTTGAGKSTFIFTMQGNEVDKKKPKRGRKRNKKQNVNSVEKISNSDTTYNNTGQLILTKTSKLPSPEIADRFTGVTENVNMYYTGKNIKEPMAFCDTEGFAGKREKQPSDAEKIIAQYAPYFVLKANPINGIIFLITEGNISTNKGETFIAFASFLTNYFDLAMVDENRKVLKKSLMLLINKAESHEDEAFEGLARLMKDSYKAYYQGSVKKNKNKKHNTEEQPNNQQKELAHLRPFFSLLLAKDIDEGKIKNRIDKHTNNLKNLDKIKDNNKIDKHEKDLTIFFGEWIDEDKVCFFYPYDKKNVEEMRQNLSQLTPIAHKYLSLGGDKISQHLIKEIIQRAYNVNVKVDKALRWKNLEQLQRLLLQQDNSKKLQTLNSKLQQLKKDLSKKNQTILYDKMLILDYNERHIGVIPLEKRNKTEIVKMVGTGLVLGVLGVVGGGVLGGGVLGGVALAELALGELALAGGGGGGGLGLGCYFYKGYLYKNIEYTKKSLICRIEVKDENKGTITWKQPYENFITKHFDKKVEGNTTMFTSKNDKGIKQDKWHLVHWSAYEQDARCCIQFFSKKKHLQASKWQIEDNNSKIERIDDLLKKLETFKNKNKYQLQKDHFVNQGICRKQIEELTKLKAEMKMINCWSNRMFVNSANKELIEQYRNNYNEVVDDKYQISMQEENHYKKMLSSYQDNTNSKHSDNQPGLLQTNYQRMEGEEECKEDNEYNNNNSSSNLKSSVPLTVTAILAGLLSQQN